MVCKDFSKFWWLPWFPAQNNTCLLVCKTVYVWTISEQWHVNIWLKWKKVIRRSHKYITLYLFPILFQPIVCFSVKQFNWFNLYHSFCFAGGVWRPIESLGEAKARTQTRDSLGCNFNFVYLMPVFQDDSWFVWNHVLRKYCQLQIHAIRNILCESVASSCLLQLICQFCNLSPWRRKVQTSLVSNLSVQESRQFSYKVRTFLCISIT